MTGCGLLVLSNELHRIGEQMKTTTTILSIIIVLSLVACATAGEPVQTKAPAAQPKATDSKIITVLQAQIDEAKKKLDANPKWQKYLEMDKEVRKLPEWIKLHGLFKYKEYLLRLTEGGK